MKTFKEAIIDRNRTNDDNYSEVNEEPTDITIIILTGSKSEDEDVVTGQMLKAAKRMKQKAFKVVIGCSWVSDFDIEKHTLTLMNYEDTNKSLTINARETVVFVRAGAFTGENSEVGRAMTLALQEAGCFMLNDLNSSILCDNKFLSYIAFSRHNIPIPKTALIPTEKALENAHNRIGGKFPVVIKTLSGTQGIGVSIVDSMQSMVSVIQSLRKYGADLLIQEHIKLDYDVRTIVLGGRIIGATRRNKVPDDFRSNAHLGATTEPYILSDEEQEIVKKVSRTMGGSFVGVDHCLVDGNIYVLECNASPGISSNYHNYDIKKVPQKNLKKIGTTDDIYTTIIEFLKYPSNRNRSSLQECGYLETIGIKGCGKVVAKVDTGNGSKASKLKVDKWSIDGDKVKWEYKEKKYVHKIETMEEVYTSDNELSDPRPVILVDMEFNNRLYKDIPISLAVVCVSDFLVCRDLMDVFKVSVNPTRKFVLSEWIPNDY